MNILLTGSNGYIGSNIIRYLGNIYNITTINRQTFDLRNYEHTKQWFSGLNSNIYFDAVIHTAIVGGNRLRSDDSSILDDNIRMYLNLLNHRHYFKKFINIGSGAERTMSDSFYGLSKKIISSSISDKLNFYNLRIYAVFDDRENIRRFIKSNIQRYLNKENLVIHQNKFMDFIYFPDFISILNKYLKFNNIPKNIDCVYKEKHTLLDIAKIINRLDCYSTNIEIQNNNNDIDYIGEYNNINIDFIGLEQGIIKTYREIKNEKNMVCPQ
jgi:nucleoside-diphosphate-sugar epimerase